MSLFSRTNKRILADYHRAIFDITNSDAHHDRAAELVSQAAVEALLRASAKALRSHKRVEKEVVVGGIFYDPKLLINVWPELEPKIEILKNLCEANKMEVSLSHKNTHDDGHKWIHCLKISATFTPPQKPRVRGAMRGLLEAFPPAL